MIYLSKITRIPKSALQAFTTYGGFEMTTTTSRRAVLARRRATAAARQLKSFSPPLIGKSAAALVPPK